MNTAPQISVAHIHKLLDAESERPVLYVAIDDGGALDIAVWAAGLVNHNAVITTREQAEDWLGDDRDDDAIREYLTELQEGADRIAAELAAA
jgi:hypothetical protein